MDMQTSSQVTISRPAPVLGSTMCMPLVSKRAVDVGTCLLAAATGHLGCRPGLKPPPNPKGVSSLRVTTWRAPAFGSMMTSSLLPSVSDR